VSADPHDPVDRALASLGSVAVPVEESSRAAERRDRVVGVLGSVLGRVRARRTFVRRVWITFFSLLSLGVVAAVAVSVSKLGEPPANVQAAAPEVWKAKDVVGTVFVSAPGRGQRPVAAGEALHAGVSLEAGDGAGISLGVSEGDVRLVSPGLVEVVATSDKERRLRVALGVVEVDLPKKLPHGQSLIIETPDAQVRVVGTAFRVEVNLDGAGKPATEVSVRRGTVWVTQDGERRATLGAGSKWRSRVEVAAVAEPAPKSEPARTRANASVPRAPRAPDPQGTLAEENRLYESALAARNAGDDRRAAEAFGQLLSRYPRSVLGEQSLAERFRALDRAGHVSLSVAAARRYLAAYPEGFARADAERIVRR
jgi:hypothetical protein